MRTVAPTKSFRALQANENGTSIFEFAIALPFLFTIIASAVQFGYALNQFMVLTDAVHQAARYAASSMKVAGNQQVTNATATQTGCGASAFSGSSSDLHAHQQVQQRVEDLVSEAKMQLSASPLCVTTGARAGIPASGQRNVYVKASIQLGGFFSALGNIPLTVEAEAPRKR